LVSATNNLSAPLIQDLIDTAKAGERRLVSNGKDLLRDGWVEVARVERHSTFYRVTSKALRIPTVAEAAAH